VAAGGSEDQLENLLLVAPEDEARLTCNTPEDLWILVEERNRFLIELFPNGALATLLKTRPPLRPMRFARAPRWDGWFQLDMSAQDRPSLENVGFDPAEFARCAAGEVTSIEVRTFNVPEGWRPLSMSDRYEGEVAAGQRMLARFPHVPPGHLETPRST
jgi:hypothetical protein